MPRPTSRGRQQSPESFEPGLDEPCMSDYTILVQVDDLIAMAMGPPEENRINFKMMQRVLFILAQQLRLLEHTVEVEMDDLLVMKRTRGARRADVQGGRRVAARARTRARADGEAGSSDSEDYDETKKGARKDKERERDKGRGKNQDDDKGISSDRDRQEKGSKGRDKEDRGTTGGNDRDNSGKSRDRDGDDIGISSDIDRDEKGSRRRDNDERGTSRDRDMDHKGKLTDRDGDNRGTSSDRDRDEKGSRIRDNDNQGTLRDRDLDEKDKTRNRDGVDRGTSSGRDRNKKGSKRRDIDDRSRDRDGVDRGTSSGRDRNDIGTSRFKDEKNRDGRGTWRDVDEDDRGTSRDSTKDEKRTRERDEDDRGTSRDRYWDDRGSSKDRDMDDKRRLREKDKDREDRRKFKENDKAQKEQQERQDRDGRRRSDESKQKERSRKDKSRVGSLELITQSQFKRLENTVNELEERAVPGVMPTLPDKKLRDDIAQGSATLVDAMKAMNIKTRIEKAEKAIGLVASMMTNLATTGALPEDIAGKAKEINVNMKNIKANVADIKSTAIKQQQQMKAKSTPRSKTTTVAYFAVAFPTEMKAVGPPGPLPQPKSPSMRGSVSTRLSASSRASTMECIDRVVHVEMEDAISALKAALTGDISGAMAKATATAEAAALNAKVIADKVDVASKIKGRIITLDSQVRDYSEQLAGFDVVLQEQMAGFQETIDKVDMDVKNGLEQLAQVNNNVNNAETAAVCALTERYEVQASQLDEMLIAHQMLAMYQHQLGDEYKSLMDSVNMMREEKANREELLEGLKDKADSSQLEGLLTNEEFDEARRQLEERIVQCHEIFQKQDDHWMSELKELSHKAGSKAEIIQVLCARDEAQTSLRGLHKTVKLLERLLGDPKDALIMRQLAKDMSCAVCKVPALMEQYDPRRGGPPVLPDARPPPVGAAASDDDEDFLASLKYADLNEPHHSCHRWCGGSHTLVSDTTARQKAPLELPPLRTKRYMGVGTNGQLYKFEEDLLPCVECYKTSEASSETGLEKVSVEELSDPDLSAGDRNRSETRRVTVLEDKGRRVTVLDGMRRATFIDDDVRRGSTVTRHERFSQVKSRQIMSMMGSEDLPQKRGTMVGANVRGRTTIIDEEVVQRLAVARDITERRTAGGGDGEREPPDELTK